MFGLVRLRDFDLLQLVVVVLHVDHDLTVCHLCQMSPFEAKAPTSQAPK